MPFTKGTKRAAKRDASESAEDEVVTSKPTKKTKTSQAADGATSGLDKDGNPYWDLSHKRRIGISEFNKTTFVNIREYYEKDGNILPGKKGISLSVPQYEALVKAMPAINAQLLSMGHKVGEASENAGAPAADESSKPVAEEKKSKKSNIEATSDEESN